MMVFALLAVFCAVCSVLSYYLFDKPTAVLAGLAGVCFAIAAVTS